MKFNRFEVYMQAEGTIMLADAKTGEHLFRVTPKRNSKWELIEHVPDELRGSARVEYARFLRFWLKGE